jgi:hypothetical protein
MEFITSVYDVETGKLLESAIISDSADRTESGERPPPALPRGPASRGTPQEAGQPSVHRSSPLN